MRRRAWGFSAIVVKIELVLFFQGFLLLSTRTSFGGQYRLSRFEIESESLCAVRATRPSVASRKCLDWPPRMGRGLLNHSFTDAHDDFGLEYHPAVDQTLGVHAEDPVCDELLPQVRCFVA